MNFAAPIFFFLALLKFPVLEIATFGLPGRDNNYSAFTGKAGSSRELRQGAKRKSWRPYKLVGGAGGSAAGWGMLFFQAELKELKNHPASSGFVLS